MSLDKIDLIDRKFSQSFLGYSRDEVDRLVSEAAETIGRLSEEKMALARTVEALRLEIKEYQGREATLRDTLLTTQRLVEDLKAEAHREAERIVDEARDKAAALVREGQERSVALNREIDTLELRRQALTTRFREMLLAALDILDRQAGAASPARGAVEAAAAEDFTFSEPADGNGTASE